MPNVDQLSNEELLRLLIERLESGTTRDEQLALIRCEEALHWLASNKWKHHRNGVKKGG